MKIVSAVLILFGFLLKFLQLDNVFWENKGMFTRQLGMNYNTLLMHSCLWIDRRTLHMLSFSFLPELYPARCRGLCYLPKLTLAWLLVSLALTHPPPQTYPTLSFPRVPCKAAFSLLAFEWRGE